MDIGSLFNFSSSINCQHPCAYNISPSILRCMRYSWILTYSVVDYIVGLANKFQADYLVVGAYYLPFAIFGRPSNLDCFLLLKNFQTHGEISL